MDTWKVPPRGLAYTFVDAASWAAIVGPITTLLGGLGGYLLAGRNDEARDGRAAEREKTARRAALADRLEEDRHNFQRDTLLELQDELQRLARVATRILLQAEETVENGGAYRLPGTLSDEEFQIRTSVRRLWVRVLDTELWKDVEGFITVCRNLGLPRGGEDKDEVLTRLYQKHKNVLETYEVINDVLGVQLRAELDRRPLVGGPSRGTLGKWPRRGVRPKNGSAEQ
jgi:hypothetical protein